MQIKGLAEVGYQAVSGVAGGAINAAIMASFKWGLEGFAADRMKLFWDNSTNTTLYKDWVGGLSEGIFLKGGLYNDKAVLDFIKS